jgi:hypothetical protein
MKAHGFDVNSTHYGLDREIYAWRQEGTPSYTLRITQYVLYYFTAPEIGVWLGRLKVAEAMREHPHVVVRSNGDTLVLDLLTGTAKTPPPRRKL